MKFFQSWRVAYVTHLEKENERLLQEVRHWQNQVLMGMRMPPLPPPMVGQPKEEPKGEPKQVTMPRQQTFHQRKERDAKADDVRWASEVVDTQVEIERTLKAMSSNGSSNKKAS